MKITIVPDLPYIQATKDVTKLIKQIVKEYCEIFKTKVKINAPLYVACTMPGLICMNGSHYSGMHVFTSHKGNYAATIYVNGELDAIDWWQTLCHELVHYCQYVTKRDKLLDKTTHKIYELRPIEMEANSLSQRFYWKYCQEDSK